MLKMSFRQFVLSAAVAVLLFTLIPGAAGYALSGTREVSVNYQNLTIELNGKAIIPKDAAGNAVYPFVYDGRTYLPVRALVNALGRDVSWDDVKKTVTIAASSGVPKITYGTPVRKNATESIKIEYANISVVLDGKKLSIINEPFLYNGSVYLPVREIADSLNCTVSYAEATNIIKINFDDVDASKSTVAAPKPAAAATANPAAASTPKPATTAAPQPTPAKTPPAATPPASVKQSPSPTAKPTPSPSATPPPASQNEGSFKSSDLVFIIKDKNVSLDQNISVVKDILGAPKSYEEVESCAYTGFDKFYAYDGIEVSTLPIGGDSICAVDVLKNAAKTAKGITVGSTLAQIEAAYGKDYTLENGVLIYWAGAKGNPKTPQLYFMLDRNNAVESFGMYNGKSAG